MSKKFDNNSMVLCFTILQHKEISTSERRKVYNRMVKMYNNSAEIRKEWKHHPSKHFFVNRFEHVKVAVKLAKHDDGQTYNDLPYWGGLYLLGMITVDDNDPETLLYWVKPGKASHMNERLTSYNTCNPHYKRFDLLRIDNPTKRSAWEKQAHKIMEQVGIAHCNHNDEWFLVSKQIYFDIKEQGFGYFFN